jgi:hypothetical protein
MGKLAHYRIGVSGGKIVITEADIENYWRKCRITEDNAPDASHDIEQSGPPARREPGMRIDGQPYRHVH